MTWARTRFGLARYRHGWGVVCGLDVTCSDPKHPSRCCPDDHGPRVYVNPGYAIDCCGNDLVLCEPLAVDLGDVCVPDDPCKPRKKDSNTPPPASEKPTTGWTSLREGLFAANLTLRYGEELARGQQRLFRGKCADPDDCEHTRVYERPCVRVEVGALNEGCASEPDQLQRWEVEFNTRMLDARNTITSVTADGPDAVLRYLRRQPPYRFCFLHDWLCDLTADAQLARRDLVPRLRFWLYYDWLLRQLACDCWSCRPDGGVPLGRVLLRRIVVNGKTECRVVLIDTSMPFRRPLRKDDCRPLPSGAVDLSPYLWQLKSEAADRLGAFGISMAAAPDSEDALFSQAPEWRFATRSSGKLRALTVRDPYDCERVAAFVGTDR